MRNIARPDFEGFVFYWIDKIQFDDLMSIVFLVSKEFCYFLAEPYFLLEAFGNRLVSKIGLFVCFDINNFPTENVPSGMNWRFLLVGGVQDDVTGGCIR